MKTPPVICTPVFQPGDRVWLVNGKQLFAATIQFAELKVSVHPGGMPMGPTHWQYGLHGLTGTCEDTDIYRWNEIDTVRARLCEAWTSEG